MAGERQIGLATCVEFIHTATLLHDDVVDESDLRRGRTTANELWGNKPSVLVGDFLFSRAFELMVEDGSLKVLNILSRASAVIAEGEVLQLVTTNDTETGEQAYLEVIKAKTATLFAAACRIGAVVATRPTVEEEALDSYGLHLGIAFQLVDDVLDYAAAQATLGKTIGDDFQEGKITLPVILAFRRGNEAEPQILAPDARANGAEGGRSGPCARAHGETRRLEGFGCACAPLRRHRARCPRDLPRWQGKTGLPRAHRLLHRARLLSANDRRDRPGCRAAWQAV